MTKLAVVAIGGNSLIKDEAHQSVPDQFNAVRETAVHLAEMIAFSTAATLASDDRRATVTPYRSARAPSSRRAFVTESSSG